MKEISEKIIKEALLSSAFLWPGHVCDIGMEFLLLFFCAWINKNLNPLETVNWVVVSNIFCFEPENWGR